MFSLYSQILLALVHTSLIYRSDPSILSHDEDDILGDKSKIEIMKRKKEYKESNKDDTEDIDKVSLYSVFHLVVRNLNGFPNRCPDK